MSSIDRIVDQSAISAFPMITIDTPDVKTDEILFTNQNLPVKVTSYIKYQPINELITKLNAIPLSKLVAKLGHQLVHNTIMYCYTVNYSTLEVECKQARQEYHSITNDYINQQQFSLSGEEHDLCYYSYGPSDIEKFLTLNASNKYTFLPMTVYPTDSANGKRHDMLIIFDNVNKKFYHFDGRNRDDYMKYSKVANKNIIDILMFYIQTVVKLYVYEVSEEWQNQAVLKPYGTMGSLDFILSTAHCYLQMVMLQYYESPACLMAVLSELNPSDLFHLVYSTVTTIIHYTDTQQIPDNCLIDFMDQQISQQIRPQTTQPVEKCSIQ